MKNPFKQQKDDAYQQRMEELRKQYEEIERRHREQRNKLGNVGTSTTVGKSNAAAAGLRPGSYYYGTMLIKDCPVDKALYVVNVGSVDVPKYCLCLLANNTFFDVTEETSWEMDVVAGFDKYPLDKIADKWLAARKKKA